MFLRLLITFSLVAPPTEEAAQAAYGAGDFEAALQMYLELAQAPGAHPPQALDGAHTTLRALHRKDPKAGHLCRARDMARELLQRDDFASEQERGAWTELEAEDTADLAGISCPAAAADDAGKPTPSTQPAAPALEETSHSEASAQAEGPAPPPVPTDSPPWRPRGRIAAASALGAVGLGLLGWMAGALVGRARANDVIATITTEATGREFTSGEVAAVEDANDRYRRLDGTAMAVGIAGGVILLTSFSVLFVPPRAASRARVRASGAGVVYAF